MREVYVEMPSAKRVQEFVGTITQLNGDFDLVSGKHILDARSLMGIFSFDLSKPLLLRIYNDNDETMAALKSYMVTGEEIGNE